VSWLTPSLSPHPSPAAQVDEKALELWKQNNALHEQLQLEQDARDKIEAEAEAKRQADREAEDAAFKVKEEQELEEAKDRIRTAAKEALLRENTQKQLKTMARRATAEIKAGIGIDPADVPKKSRIPFRQAYVALLLLTPPPLPPLLLPPPPPPDSLTSPLSGTG
jgi:hypothetical protein